MGEVERLVIMEGGIDVRIVGKVERRERVDAAPILAADHHRARGVGRADRRKRGGERGEQIGVGQLVVRFVADLEPQSRSEEHTSELQSLMRISYAIFCLKKKNTQQQSRS